MAKSLKVSRTQGASCKLHYLLGLPSGPLPGSEDLGVAGKTPVWGQGSRRPRGTALPSASQKGCQ